MSQPMTKPRYVIGIDPGFGGGIALLDTQEKESGQVWDFPLAKGKKTAFDLVVLNDRIRILAKFPGVVAAIEDVHSLPRQAGAFRFGFSTGILHGLLAAHGVPINLVPASKWKPALRLNRRTPDEPQEATKTRARELATYLFPHLASQFSRVKDDGRAEAILIAFYFANK